MAGSNPGNITVRGAHINTLLSNFSIGYRPSGMVAEQIFPVLPVRKESDYYAIWDKGGAFRVERSDGKGSKRADGTRAHGVNFGFSLAQYAAEEYAEETQLTDRTRDNADDVFQLETTYISKVQDHLLLDEELRIASLLTNTGTYAASNVTTFSGTGQWNNAGFASQAGTQSVIEANIDTGREAIRIATGGKEANTIILPRAVARVVARDVGVRDQIKYTDHSILVDGTLPPTLWGLKVLIPSVTYNTAVEGEAVTMVDVWGKNVVLAYVDPNPSINMLTLGMIFRARPWQVKQWRDESVDSTFYRPSVVQAEQLVSADCGYLIASAIA